MPPAKIVAPAVMKQYILNIMRETFGKGSILVPAMRIEMKFGNEVAVADMATCNTVRLLLCCEGDGSDCSFLTPARSEDRIMKTWWTTFDWTHQELTKAFNGADRLCLFEADTDKEDVVYVIFHEEDGIQKERLVDEAVKRLAREVKSSEYRAGRGKAYAKKSTSAAADRQSFKMHLHNELLPYFHRLFMKENKEVECDLLDPTDIESSLDKSSADIFVAYGSAS